MFVDDFLSKIDDDGKTRKILLRIKREGVPLFAIKDLYDIIRLAGNIRYKDETDINWYHDVLYLLSCDQIIAYLDDIVSGKMKQVQYFCHIPLLVLHTIFFVWKQEEDIEKSHHVFRTTFPLKCHYHFVSTAVSSYEIEIPGSNFKDIDPISDDNMVKIHQWLNENEPIVKSASKQ